MSEDLSSDRLVELSLLAKEAAPRPWELLKLNACPNDPAPWWALQIARSEFGPDGELAYVDFFTDEATGRYVTAACNILPALIAELERLRGILTELTGDPW